MFLCSYVLCSYVPKPEEVVEVGQDISAIIKRFRPEEKRISISLREVGQASSSGIDEDED